MIAISIVDNRGRLLKGIIFVSSSLPIHPITICVPYLLKATTWIQQYVFLNFLLILSVIIASCIHWGRIHGYGSQCVFDFATRNTKSPCHDAPIKSRLDYTTPSLKKIKTGNNYAIVLSFGLWFLKIIQFQRISYIKCSVWPIQGG